MTNLAIKCCQLSLSFRIWSRNKNSLARAQRVFSLNNIATFLLNLIHLLLYNLFRCAINLHNFMQFRIEESTRNSDALGCFSFVASKHPDFDLGISEVTNALLYIILQQVFHSSNAQHCYTFFQITVFIFFAGLCNYFLRYAVKVLLGEHKGTKSQFSKLISRIYEEVIILIIETFNQGDNCHIRPFNKV